MSGETASVVPETSKTARKIDIQWILVYDQYNTHTHTHIYVAHGQILKKQNIYIYIYIWLESIRIIKHG
jgi:hypothetical protein